MADFADYFHFADDGNGIDVSLVDGVAEEAVAVLDRNVTEIDGVARAVCKAVAEDIDGVEMLRAQIESIY